MIEMQLFKICVVPQGSEYVACLDDDDSVTAVGSSSYEAMIELIVRLQAEDAEAAE